MAGSFSRKILDGQELFTTIPLIYETNNQLYEFEAPYERGLVNKDGITEKGIDYIYNYIFTPELNLLKGK